MRNLNKSAILLSVVYMIIAFAVFVMFMYNRPSLYRFSWLCDSAVQCYLLMVLLILNINQFRNSNATAAVVIGALVGMAVPVKLLLESSMYVSTVYNQSNDWIIMTIIIAILQIVSVGYYADCHLKNKFILLSSLAHIICILLCLVCSVLLKESLLIPPSFISLGLLIVSNVTAKSEQ